MTEMPNNLRHMVIEKTHGPIIEKISFFKQKNDINKNFTTQIIYELKNMNLQNGELLYQQNDMPEQMYFLFQGRFKLLVDLNAFIKDEKIFVELQKREQLRKKMQKDKEGADEEEGLDVNPNFAAVIQYVEGSYFGDADYFAFATNLDKRGRDTSAQAQGECSVFIMNKAEVLKIKQNFINEYREMAALGIKRHKIHQIRIAKFVNRYQEWAKMIQHEEMSSSNEMDSSSFSKDDPEISDNQESNDKDSFCEFDSEKELNTIANLNDDQIDFYYNYARKKLEISNFVPENDVNSANKNAGRGDKKDYSEVVDYKQSLKALSKIKQKALSEKVNFKNQFTETIKNFEVNVNFLSTQQREIK